MVEIPHRTTTPRAARRAPGGSRPVARARHRTAIVAASALLCILLPSLAPAHVLPGPFVLGRCARALGELRGLEVILEVQDGAELYIERIVIPKKGRVAYAAERPRAGVETLQRLLSGDVQGLIGALAIDVSRTSLALFDDRVAIRLGATEADDGLPQLWVDQDSFLPVRLSAGPRVLELRGLHSLTTQGWFPRRIIVSERGRPVWSAQVVRIRLLP